MHSLTKKIRFSWIILFGVLVIVFLGSLLNNKWHWTRGRGYYEGIDSTRHTLDQIAGCIEQTVVLYKRFPCEVSILPTNIPSTLMYRSLDAIQGFGNYQWAQRNLITDYWAREIHFRLDRSDKDGTNSVTSTNTSVAVRVLIWSNGYNGLDEQAEGDDIRVSFIVHLQGK